ncbi:MAG: YXWGXW repeat-containing protein, partial [Terracidiphilus sp.]
MNIQRSVRGLALAVAVAFFAAASPAQFFISVNIGPPVMPVYVQPACPAPDLMWTPGHWSWDPDFADYYWVPGAWVPAPYTGALWTPGYWGWGPGGVYMWHAGYWGPHIGYYGGVSYGGGYMGIGYAGGTWNGGHFAYNTAVINVNRTVVTNVYVNQTIVQQTTIVNVNHVAYSGGPGGVQHVATPEEQIADHDQHVQRTSYQTQAENQAKSNPGNFSKNNGGHPTNLALTKPLPVEHHAAPAGFKPPPPRPMTELAKVQAPLSVQKAAAESSTKTATAVKKNPPPPHPAPAPKAHGTTPALAKPVSPPAPKAHPAAP